MKIAIIGGGPSGLIAASRINGDVHLFEKNSDIGKKLLLTGNGKCNYWNTFQDICKYHSKNSELLSKIINEKNLNKTFTYLNELGIVPKDKNGYLYPYSGTAGSVKEILKKSCLLNNVVFHFDTEVLSIVFKDNQFIINGECFDKVVVATGGLSIPKTGCSDTGYKIAKSFKHTINDLNPSLMQLVTNTNLEKLWAGIRCDVIASISVNDEFLKKEIGEVQFTDYGISGICIFNLSSIARKSLNNNDFVLIHLNFVPWCDTDFKEFLLERNKLLPNRTIVELCEGFLNYKVTTFILKHIGISINESINDLTNKELDLLVSNIIDFNIPIVDTKGYEVAQVTSGGVSLEELNLETLESLYNNGLYFCGEILDIDGDCGGYNLTNAFVTGLLVGDAINDKIKKC